MNTPVLSKNRCAWVPETDELYVRYHDAEWGVPARDDRTMFEFLTLESAQAGLSWRTVLHKRENYRRLFCEFNPERVACLDTKDIDRLLQDPGIIRNRAKVTSAVNNARAFLSVAEEFGSFTSYAWGFVGNAPIDGKRKTIRDVPAVTREAEAFAADVRRRGFRFFGPTVCYAHMQAVGMANDHTTDCFRYEECLTLSREMFARKSSGIRAKKRARP